MIYFQVSLQTGVPPPDESCTISVSTHHSMFLLLLSVILFHLLTNPLARHLKFQVNFKIAQLAASGLKVSRLDIYGEVSEIGMSTSCCTCTSLVGDTQATVVHAIMPLPV